MKCLVHINRTVDADATRFVMRLTPLTSGPTALELFTSERQLTRRLSEIGLTKICLQMTLSNLRDDDNAMWSSFDVAERVFFPQFTQPSVSQNEQEL